MTPKQNAPPHPKAMEGASDDKPHFASASRTASGKRTKQAVQGLALLYAGQSGAADSRMDSKLPIRQ